MFGEAFVGGRGSRLGPMVLAIILSWVLVLGLTSLVLGWPL